MVVGGGGGDSGGRHQLDAVFNNIPRNSSAFLMWRVQSLQLVAVPSADYGKFYRGDAYVVYAASERNGVITAFDKPRPARGLLQVHLHFWLGSECSVDEAAVAAIKTVELDMCLGGAPVQHRETEAHETARFRAYFKNSIRVLVGGVSSGLRHVTDEVVPALFHVKGKRSVLVRELNQVSWDVMNDGDVYVLESQTIIYVWLGRYSNNLEKLQGAKFASVLRNERGGRRGGARVSIVIVEDGTESSLEGEERQEFERLLPLERKMVQSHEDIMRDEEAMEQVQREQRLYRCSDDSGSLRVTEVKTGPFLQRDLHEQDAFIIDGGSGADGGGGGGVVWVWVGRRASANERKEAMRNALGFVAKKKYSKNTRISRVIDGGEPPEFRALFRDWRDRGHGKHEAPRIATVVQTSFDAQSLHARPALAAAAQVVDDGTALKEVWRVHKFGLESVPEHLHGQFYMGDCYVVLYAYHCDNLDHYLIYHWQGSASSVDEQATAAVKAVELDQKLSGRAVIVRLVQGKESPHFMMLFKGKMVVYEGGYASGFRGRNERDEGRKRSYLLQVRGTTPYNTRAIEVDLRAGSLNSNDCFVVVTPSETILWCGRGCSGDEREMAKALMTDMSYHTPTIVLEGRERETFWKVLGGREPYADSPGLASPQPHARPPRLFQCSNASGRFKAEEVLNFSQEDLVEDDVMMLDTWDTVFVWLGVHCNRVERLGAQNLALAYLESAPSRRGDDTPVMVIKQGYEPPTFTGFFGVWDNDLWNNNMTYKDICERLQEECPGMTVLVTRSKGNEEGDSLRRTYPMTLLRITDPDKLPDDIDPTKKEDYVGDADFQREFGMTREQFQELPEWKRQQLKKRVGIY